MLDSSYSLVGGTLWVDRYSVCHENTAWDCMIFESALGGQIAKYTVVPSVTAIWAVLVLVLAINQRLNKCLHSILRSRMEETKSANHLV